MREPVTVHRPFLVGRLIGGLACFAFGVGFTIFGLSLLSTDVAGTIVFALFGLVFVSGGIRAAMAQVTIGPDEICLRGILPTRRLARSSITDIVTRPFNGSFLIRFEVTDGRPASWPMVISGGSDRMNETLGVLVDWLNAPVGADAHRN